MDMDNNGTLTGNVASTPLVTVSSDGKLEITAFILKVGVGDRANLVQVKAFTTAGSQNPYANRVVGEKVTIAFRIEARPYVGQDGKTVYPQPQIVATQIRFDMTKDQVQQMVAERALREQQQAEVPAQPVAQQPVAQTVQYAQQPVVQQAPVQISVEPQPQVPAQAPAQSVVWGVAATAESTPWG